MPAGDEPFAQIPKWLILKGSNRALKVYAAMLILGDHSRRTYRGGNSRLATQLEWSVDSVARGIRELLVIHALTEKRRTGSSTVFKLGPHNMAQPTEALKAAEQTGDSRNATRGTRERVEDWNGARLAQYFEDRWDSSEWIQLELRGVKKFSTRQSIVNYLDGECDSSGWPQRHLKAEMDIFFESPASYTTPDTQTTGWVRFTKVRMQLFGAVDATSAEGRYDTTIGDWATNIHNFWHQYGPPSRHHQWNPSSDTHSYAWYHATPVQASTDPKATEVDSWSNADLAEHAAGVAPAQGLTVDEQSVSKFERYLDKHRPDSIRPHEVLGTFDSRWAAIQEAGPPEEGSVLSQFMQDPTEYSNPTQSVRRLGWVRYGLNPQLVIGQSPTTQRLQGD